MGLFSNLFRKKLPPIDKREILSADEMKQKYNLRIEDYCPLSLNSQKVPEQFRDLIPFAEKWGISDDVIRDDLHQNHPGKKSWHWLMPLVAALRLSINGSIVLGERK